MNQKTILALVAIVTTVGIVVAASTIATPLASAVRSTIVREKDTKSNPNSAERTSGQESDSGHGGHPTG
jgi:hypothetical protein